MSLGGEGRELKSETEEKAPPLPAPRELSGKPRLPSPQSARPAWPLRLSASCLPAAPSGPLGPRLSTASRLCSRWTPGSGVFLRLLKHSPLPHCLQCPPVPSHCKPLGGSRPPPSASASLSLPFPSFQPPGKQRGFLESGWLAEAAAGGGREGNI